MVLEANIASVLLRVPTNTMGRISIDLDLEYHRVILDVALVRVQHVSPAHVVREAPIILLAEEYMRYLPGEFFTS